MTFTRWMIYILWHRIPCQVHAEIVPEATIASYRDFMDILYRQYFQRKFQWLKVIRMHSFDRKTPFLSFAIYEVKPELQIEILVLFCTCSMPG